MFFFGSHQASFHTIEYQKRGLPHAHILLWVVPEDKVHLENIDSVISAEIPSRQRDPKLHELVIKHMIHGPCGPFNPVSPCMRNGKCDKQFPKSTRPVTQQGDDSYPLYRRRLPEDGGATGQIVMHRDRQNVSQEIDSRWVVPHNPFLLREFQCHINVEYCGGIKGIKYITKYVTKGTDQATFEINGQTESPRDETKEYQNARYVGSTEAAWRLFEFNLSENLPKVETLDVHLENGQRIFFRHDAPAAQEQPPPVSKLTVFLTCVLKMNLQGL